MTKLLKRKFIFISMTAITLLIVLMLGGINIFNLTLTARQSDETLAFIMDTASKQEPGPPTPSRPDRQPPINGSYFTALVAEDGRLAELELSHAETLTEQQAQKLISAAYSAGKSGGALSGYRYLMRQSPFGTRLAFLSTAAERTSALRLLLLSLLMGALCWGLMLSLVLFLSARAVRPIVENIDRQKQFITDAGHELKTPLAIIAANAEALELYQGESKWSHNIRAQTARLADLTQNLLSLARGAERPPRPEQFDFSALCATLCEEFSERFATRKISFTVSLFPALILYADPSQMRRLLSLLLDNAAKYTNEGGNVHFALVKDDRHLTLTLQNSVLSLPALPPEKLFERFTRGSASRNQAEGGYGIGLATAASLAKSTGAQLTATYPNQNTVLFTLII